MPKVRKDNKGRNLRPGETQRSDGSYMFVYKLGKKKKYIYIICRNGVLWMAHLN